MKSIPLILLAALSGCATLDMSVPPPADWPKLEVRRVAEKWMVPFCGIFMLACANINFDTMRCTYFAPDGWMKDHELEHCRGRDHIGSSELRDYWEQWKARK